MAPPPTTVPPGPPPAPATTSPAPTTTVPAATTTRPATTQPPPTVPVVEDNILDVLAAAGQFGQLLAAIDAAGSPDCRAGPVHAVRSTDEAFSQLAEPLPTEPEALQAVLLYHVVEDNLSGFELMGMTSVPTAQGTDLKLGRGRPDRA